MTLDQIVAEYERLRAKAYGRRAEVYPLPSAILTGHVLHAFEKSVEIAIDSSSELRFGAHALDGAAAAYNAGEVEDGQIAVVVSSLQARPLRNLRDLLLAIRRLRAAIAPLVQREETYRALGGKL